MCSASITIRRCAGLDLDQRDNVDHCAEFAGEDLQLPRVRGHPLVNDRDERVHRGRPPA